MKPRLEKPTARPRIVLDTNVLVSASLSSLRGREASPSFLIVNLFDQDSNSAPVLLVSDAILAEYAKVLGRPQLGIPKELVDSSVEQIVRIAEMVVPVSHLEVPDKDDSMFLECALDGLANYLVTGNKRHYPKWTIVVTPREFLNIHKV